MYFNNAYDFSRWLKEELKYQGLSQRELAERSGLHANSLSGYVNNQHEPTISQVLCICTALGYSVCVRSDEL